MSDERYFVDRDESGDYYIVPVRLKSVWESWCLGGYEESDEPPEGCKYVGGHAMNVTFTDPVPAAGY